MYNLKYMLVKTIALSNKSLGCSDLHLCRSSFKSNVLFKSNQMPITPLPQDLSTR